MDLSRDARRALALAGLALVLRLVWVAAVGPRVSYDGLWFLANGQLILDGDPEGFDSPPYYAPVSMFAALLIALFGQHATTVWVLVQAVATGLATIPLYHVGRRLFGSAVATIAATTHALLWEAFQWDAYVVTDSVFLAAVIGTLWVVLRADDDPGGPWRHARNACLVALAFLRPVGFLVGATWLAWRLGGRVPPHRRVAVFAAVALLAVGAAAAAFLASAYVGEAGALFARNAAAGQVIDMDPWARIEYEPDPAPEALLPFIAANPLAFLGLAVLRFGAFFLFALPRYSAAHLLLNLVTLAPVILLGLIGGWRGLRRGGPQRFLALLVLAFASFHAVTLLDYDLRYRVPTLPVLELFFAATLVTGIDAVRARRARQASPDGPPPA